MSDHVPRRLIVRRDDAPEEEVRDMDVQRLGSVVVTIAEPGGGKTAFVKALEKSSRSKYFRASSFVSWGPKTAENFKDQLVIVDGLDEVAARNWVTVWTECLVASRTWAAPES